MFGIGDESGTGICIVYRVDVNEADITGIAANTTSATKAIPKNGNLRGALSRF